MTLLTHWKQAAAIGAGALLMILLLAMLATRATLADAKSDRDLAYAQLKISGASVDRLTDEIEQVARDQAALAQSDDLRMQASREAMQVADAASAVRQAAIDRLNASAAAVRPGAAAEVVPAACEVSQAVEAVWK